MKREDYRPTAPVPGRAEARPEGGRWTLVFVRDLRHPPSQVWLALTDPDHLREWAPFDADRNLESPGTAELTLIGGATAEVFQSDVRRADPPRLLEYTWGEAILRWELEALESGAVTRLTLRQTIDDPTWLPKVAAGWHMCLDVAEYALAGEPIGRIVAGEAKRFGWERLNAEYADQFGIENTGWPEGMREEP